MHRQAMVTAPRSGMPPSSTTGDPRWARILARDKAADGTFWYSVATTGVYCRPSCPSRTCNPDNVAIHDSLQAARATGCRACLRCRPDGPPDDARTAVVAQACRLIDAAEQALPLAGLAQAVGCNPSRLHRSFKAATGVTPRAYAAARRAARLRERLGDGGTVTQAIHGAGYGSSGRFYAEAGDVLGMTPRRFRDGGAGELLRVAVENCSLGFVLVAASAAGIAAILIGDDADRLRRDLRERFPRAVLAGGDAAFAALVARVVGLVEAPASGPTIASTLSAEGHGPLMPLRRIQLRTSPSTCTAARRSAISRSEERLPSRKKPSRARLALSGW